MVACSWHHVAVLRLGEAFFLFGPGLVVRRRLLLQRGTMVAVGLLLAAVAPPPSPPGRGCFTPTIIKATPKGEHTQGEWMSLGSCAAGEFAVEMQQRIDRQRPIDWQRIQGDNSGLNAVKMKCTDGTTIDSHKGVFGTWGEWTRCPGRGAFDGFAIKNEGPQWWPAIDATAANAVRMYCGSTRSSPDTDAGRGDWSDQVSCPPGSAICGFKIRLEGDQGPSSDDTAMNDIEMECCPKDGLVRCDPPPSSPPSPPPPISVYEAKTPMIPAGGRQRDFHYLDRHPVACRDSYALQQFKLYTYTDNTMEYKYTCAKPTFGRVTDTTPEQTSKTESVSYNEYLGLTRLVVECPYGSVISGFKLSVENGDTQRENGENPPREMHYDFNCSKPSSGDLGRCTDMTTLETDMGTIFQRGLNGAQLWQGLDFHYLDQQDVACEPEEALQMFVLETPSPQSTIAYRMRCCSLLPDPSPQSPPLPPPLPSSPPSPPPSPPPPSDCWEQCKEQWQNQGQERGNEGGVCEAGCGGPDRACCRADWSSPGCPTWENRDDSGCFRDGDDRYYHCCTPAVPVPPSPPPSSPPLSASLQGGEGDDGMSPAIIIAITLLIVSPAVLAVHCIRRRRRRLTGPAGKTDCLAAKMKRAWLPPACPDGATKFANASLSELVLGQPAAAALGICRYMCVAEADVGAGMAAGVDSIVREVTTNGSAVDVECLDYVLHKACGQSSLAFQNGLKRDCGADGELLPSRQTSDGKGGWRPMTIDDFIAHPHARSCNLTEAHVVALRLYTTAAFQSINAPLRDLERFANKVPHPLPVTVALIR